MDPLPAPAFPIASEALAKAGYRYAPSRRSRLGSALASLAIVALIGLVLWRMGLLDQGRSGSGSRFTSVSLQSGESQTASPRTATKAHQAARTNKAEPVKTVQPTPKVAVKPPPPLTTKPALPFIAMSGADMASGDISHMKGQSSAGGGSGTSHGSTYGPGDGPGGVSLVNVAWYREPTDAELAPYMPHKLAGRGSATIACRMIEHYHVEDCQELSESPPGSGLSRALRQAAWQFQVRPPLVGGKPQLGTWVRIRFTWANRDEGPAAGE
jgi:hypothetical protein